MKHSAIATTLEKYLWYISACRLIDHGIITGIPIINERKLGMIGVPAALNLNKDQDSDKLLKNSKKIPEITECYYITELFYIVHQNYCKRSRAHATKYSMKKSIQYLELPRQIR
jgi:Lrp/AsnC family transcriptional regulator for asnA, asnC and gidA